MSVCQGVEANVWVCVQVCIKIGIKMRRSEFASLAQQVPLALSLLLPTQKIL